MSYCGEASVNISNDIDNNVAPRYSRVSTRDSVTLTTTGNTVVSMTGRRGQLETLDNEISLFFLSKL